MPKAILIALAFYLKWNLYKMEFSSEFVEQEKDVILSNLNKWISKNSGDALDGELSTL